MTTSPLNAPPTAHRTTKVAPARVPSREPDPAALEAGDFQKSRATRVGTRAAGAHLQAPGPNAPVLRLNPGAVVPGTRYRIVRWLGEGGMGVVYEAEHLDIERRAAFKILRFDLSHEPRMAQVFRDEARAASKLGSPHIVDIYDFGELPDGRLYFCMELLEGRDLVPSSEDDTMDPADLIAVLRQVCKGLATAHKAGVVHRDIKPENIILVDRDGRHGFVKIVDFGISAMLAAGQSSDGGIAGTPHYMAPEQITGGAFDGRLDIYAVGVTAYELLVGRPPFDSDDLETLLRKHLTEPPPRPSEIRPDRTVPKPLEEVIMRCLAKSPDERYRDMADLEAALCEAQIAAGLHTSWDDLPLPELDDPQRRERLLREMPSPLQVVESPRRRFLWPAVAGLSLLLAVAFGAYAFTRGPTEEERAVVETLAEQAKQAAALADWVLPTSSADAPTALRTIMELERVQGPAEDVADKEAEVLRKQFAQTLFQNGARLWEIPGARGIARDYYVWGLLFDDSDEEALERAGVSSGQLAELRARFANGEYTQAELALSKIAAAAVEEDADRKAALEAEIAQMADEPIFGNTTRALLSDAARAAKVRITRKRRPEQVPPQPSPVDASEASAGTGGPENPGESPVKRRRLTRRDVDAMLGKGKRDPKRAAALAEEGLAALRAGRRKEAEQLFHQAVAFDRKNATALMGLSDVYFDLGRTTKAIQFAERAVRASPRNRTYRLKLGDAYYKALRYRDALEQYEKAKDLGEGRAAARIAKVRAKLGESG